MTAEFAYARPLPAREPHPRHVEIVTTRAQRKARPRALYAVITIASLFAIFAAQLLLSIVVSEGAYEIQGLQGQRKELVRTEQALREDLAVFSSTQNLATQAAHLGMVPNATPLALDLTTGGVYGLPGSADPMGCGGGCNLITNSLLADIPLVDPTAQASAAQPTTAPPLATQATTAGTAGAPPTILVTDAIPAPVTH